MEQRFSVEPGRKIPRSFLHQEFTQQERVFRQSFRIQVVGTQIQKLVSKHGAATRLQHDNRNASPNGRTKCCNDLFQPFARRSEHPVIVKRPSAAHIGLRHLHLETRVFEDRHRCFGHARIEVVVKRVRPEQNWRAMPSVFLSFEPAFKRLWRQSRQRSFRGHLHQPLHQLARAGSAHQQVGQHWGGARQAGPDMHQPENISVQRSEAALVIMREELRFIGRHVHLNRAITLCTLCRINTGPATPLPLRYASRPE